ncbi:MAG: ABC transporter permease [Planctomycetes bacterium]|nr:ABC transporter permease [Planctomycetota bacterium]MBL7145104.1 ABC transporter permease [Phycisphaerae bacterium]
MQKILKIAQREYIETVKTKAFLLGIVMLPLIIVVIIVVMKRMSPDKTGPQPPVKVAVNDLSGLLADEIKTSFDSHNQKNPNRQIQFHKLEIQQNSDAVEERARNNLRQGQVDVYVVLDRDVLDGSGKIHLYTYKQKASSIDILSTIEYIFYKTVVNQRYKMQNLSQELLEKLRNVPIERVEIGYAEGQDRVQNKTDTVLKMMVPFFFMYLMFLGIISSGQHMISSVIEEKSSRVIEVLLSAVSPFELMAGKILGLAGTGFTLVSLWAGAAFFTASSQGLNIDVTAELVFYFAIYYILGFLLISSVLAAAGSVCNTIKETQSLMMPIMMVFIIPLVSWFKVVQDPNGTLSRVFSFIPPLTPMVMILRLSSGSEIWIIEIIASIILLAVTVLVAMWGAAKVFRAGILMYGKRLSVREVCRCLLQS